MSPVSIDPTVHLELEKLPAVPQVLLRLIEACHKSDICFDELAQIIRQDIALTAKVISVAKSSALVQWNSLNDLNRILVVLGLDAIKSLCITTAVHQFFNQFPANKRHGTTVGGFWLEALSCAFAARALARLTDFAAHEEAYLCGLLHNLGQIAYLQLKPQEYPALLQKARSDSQLAELEQAQFGASNSEVCAHITRDWVSDSFFADALLYQNEPAEQLYDTPQLIKLVNLAHKFSSPRCEPDLLFQEADTLFGLNRTVVNDLRTEIGAEVAQVAKGFGIRIKDNAPTNLDDEKTRQDLARHVKGFALLHGLHQPPTQAEKNQGIWQRVLRNLQVLFGLERTLALRLDPQTQTLIGEAGCRIAPERLELLKLQLQPVRSLAAQAIAEGRALSSRNPATGAASVIDRQLRQLLDRPELLCIPIFQGEHPLGVVIAGLNGAQQDTLTEDNHLLSTFAQAAATSLQQQQRQQAQETRLLEDASLQQQGRSLRLLHEASNPLSVINNYLHVLSRQLQDNQDVQKQLELIRSEIDRVGSILLRLKDSDEQSVSPQGDVDLNLVLKDLLTVFRASLFSSHKIHDQLDLDPALQPVKTNANAVKQIITNLLKNTVEAMPDGGQVIISSRAAVNVSGRTYVELKIQDNGPGISAEILSKAFTPVTSTKGKEHSGLGLTIVSNLVTDLEGTISCRNQTGGGAEFVVLLPQKRH